MWSRNGNGESETGLAVRILDLPPDYAFNPYESAGLACVFCARRNAKAHAMFSLGLTFF